MSNLAGAVIGDPISHSLSPLLHLAGSQFSEFHKIVVSAGQLQNFLDNTNNLVGLSVTMPLKTEAARCVDMADGLAKTLGVVNTIVFQPTGNSRLVIGFNTDVAGIVNAICEGASNTDFSRAVILGSGATATSALAALRQLHIADIAVCARRIAGTGIYKAAHKLNLDISTYPLSQASEVIATADLVISTLPAGVADNIASDLTTLELAQKTLLDVIYEPRNTALNKVFNKSGATIIPGWLMLLHQAVDQSRIFTGSQPNIARMRAALLQELKLDIH